MDTHEDLIDLSTREMQALGAMCLFRFCRANGISHAYIDELVDYLLSILSVDLLDGWEDRGSYLKLSGRGDPVPEPLASQLPADVREDFDRLVGFVVEIGLADMYGRSSREPLYNLVRSMLILDDHGVQRPTIAELFEDRPPRGEKAPDWGDTYSKERYEKLRRHFQ